MKTSMQQTEIYKILKQRESEYLGIVNDAIKYAESILPQINRVFNTYTIHGVLHSVNVAEHMFDLLDSPECFNDLELTVMLYSALFHDIGMVASEEEIDEIKKNEKLIGNKKYSKVKEKYGDDHIALQECIRSIHGQRSKSLIESIRNTDAKIFIIPNATNVNFQNELALICQSHTEDFSWITAHLSKDTWKGDNKINCQFISMILRLADYLDFDEQRAPINLYNFLTLNEQSNLEWLQHFSIDNFSKIKFNDKKNQKEVLFQGKSKDPNTHRKLLRYFECINKELFNACRLSEKYADKKYLLNISTHVIDLIDTDGFSFSNFKLELNFGAITKLLMGENIYGNKTYGLRELIQNSIDACKTMMEESEGHPKYKYQNYIPNISIIINEEQNTVTIYDNGSGMSLSILKNCFLNIGVSYYKSDEYILQGKKYSPIGNYGIGFLACFMLSDKVAVRTRHFNETETLAIDFEKDSEYISLASELNHQEHGTEIILNYKQFMNVFDKDIDSVKEFIENNFLNCGIPIYLIIESSNGTDKQLCNLDSIDKIINKGISLNKYLNGIEVYVDADSEFITFAEDLYELTNIESYYYDSQDGELTREIPYGYRLKDLVSEEMIEYYMIPIVDEFYSDDFLNAYEVLDDYDDALDKVDYDLLNMICIDEIIDYPYRLIEYGESIFDLYGYDDFCCEFGHSYSVPLELYKERTHVITSDSHDKVLAFNCNVRVFDPYKIRFGKEDAISRAFCKNVYLSKFNMILPYVVDGFRIKQMIINIDNEHLIPDVARHDIDEKSRSNIAYAIGKAIHLWILDNIKLSEKEKELIKLFINEKYSDANVLIK